MPLNCPSFGTKLPLPNILKTNFLSNHVSKNLIFFNKHNFKSLIPIGSLSKLNQTQGFSSTTLMENSESLSLSCEKYSKELEIAVRTVHLACSLCQKLQNSLVTKTTSHVHSKHDDSPVTIADWSVQATVSWILSDALGSKDVSIIAGEDVEVLSEGNSAGLLEAVVKAVNESLAETPRFGLSAPNTALDNAEVLMAIGRCNSNGGHVGRFWALDFVRGDQFAVSLALIEEGQVVLGVLGCPNYPIRKEWLSYPHRYRRLMSKLTPVTSETWDKGCVLYAKRGSGRTWMQPLLQEHKNLVWPNSARPVAVSSIDNPALATICDPVEKANSSHSFTAGLAHSVELRKQPLRVYDMVKYATVARGDAEVFMKFARAGYKEKIGNHAAGVLILEEAGGVVTDARGCPLDFSKGQFLEGLDRGIVASSGAKLHEKIVQGVDASWNSSSL